MTFEKECPICGATFTTTYPRKKYCTLECSEIAGKIKHKEYMESCRPLHEKGVMEDILNDVMIPFQSKSKIVEHNTMARKLGVDYGTYIAMLEGRLPMPRMGVNG